MQHLFTPKDCSLPLPVLFLYLLIAHSIEYCLLPHYNRQCNVNFALKRERITNVKKNCHDMKVVSFSKSQVDLLSHHLCSQCPNMLAISGTHLVHGAQKEHIKWAKFKFAFPKFIKRQVVNSSPMVLCGGIWGRNKGCHTQNPPHNASGDKFDKPALTILTEYFPGLIQTFGAGIPFHRTIFHRFLLTVTNLSQQFDFIVFQSVSRIFIIQQLFDQCNLTFLNKNYQAQRPF